MRKSILLIVCILNLFAIDLYAQESAIKNAMQKKKNTIENAINKQKDIVENAINKQIQMFAQVNSNPSSELKHQIFSPFYEGWNIRSTFGLTNYRSSFNESNDAGSFEIAGTKKINNYINITSSLNIMNLQGKRNLESVKELDYQYYNLYEGNGDYFASRITELSLVFSGDLLNRLLSLIMLQINEDFIFPKRFTIDYNIGVGVCNFHSIRYNLISDSYIYAYGYNDLQGNFESRKSFWKLPKSTTLIYGPSIIYHLSKVSKIYLSSFMRYAYTPYLDADKGLGEGDRFRNVSLGYIYSFNFLKK